jgi:hypothetical protein
MHAHAYAKQGKITPFYQFTPRAELAGVPPAVSRGAAAGVDFPPWECKRPVAVKFARMITRKPAGSPAGRGNPSRSEDAPISPPWRAAVDG